MKPVKILILIIIILSTVNLTYTDSSQYLLDKTLKEVNPRQVTLWSNFKRNQNKELQLEYQLVLQNLMRKVPTKTVNINKLPPHARYYYNVKSSFQYNQKISAPLHIIILDEDHKDWFQKFHYLLYELQQSLFYLITTKCLLFFLQK